MGRATKILSFSLSPKVAREIENLAKEKGVNKSQLLREMVDVYESYYEEKEFEELQRYGQKKAAELGIKSEKDIERIIHEARGIKSSF